MPAECCTADLHGVKAEKLKRLLEGVSRSKAIKKSRNVTCLGFQVRLRTSMTSGRLHGWSVGPSRKWLMILLGYVLLLRNNVHPRPSVRPSYSNARNKMAIFAEGQPFATGADYVCVLFLLLLS